MNTRSTKTIARNSFQCGHSLVALLHPPLEAPVAAPAQCCEFSYPTLLHDAPPPKEDAGTGMATAEFCADPPHLFHDFELKDCCVVTVGRDADFVIEHPLISPLQCSVVLLAGEVLLHDWSTSGTYVDGKLVGSGCTCTLISGSVVTFVLSEPDRYGDLPTLTLQLGWASGLQLLTAGEARAKLLTLRHYHELGHLSPDAMGNCARLFRLQTAQLEPPNWDRPSGKLERLALQTWMEVDCFCAALATSYLLDRVSPDVARNWPQSDREGRQVAPTHLERDADMDREVTVVNSLADAGGAAIGYCAGGGNGSTLTPATRSGQKRFRGRTAYSDEEGAAVPVLQAAAGK